MTPECIAWIGFAGSLAGALLAGVFALIVMLKTTKQTREIQDENKNQSVQPLLVLRNSDPITKRTDGSGKGISVIGLENVGNGFAKDIRFHFSEDSNIKTQNIVTTLKPNETIGRFDLNSDKLYNVTLGDSLIVTLSYSNIYGKIYTTIYELICEQKDIFAILKVSFK